MTDKSLERKVDTAFKRLEYKAGRTPGLSLSRRVMASANLVRLAGEAPVNLREDIAGRLVQRIYTDSDASVRALDAVVGIAELISSKPKERDAFRKRIIGGKLRHVYRSLRDGKQKDVFSRLYGVGGEDCRSKLVRVFFAINDSSGIANAIHDRNDAISKAALDRLVEGFDPKNPTAGKMLPVLVRHSHSLEIFSLLKKNFKKIEKNKEKRRALAKFLEEHSSLFASGKKRKFGFGGLTEDISEMASRRKIQEASLKLIETHYKLYFANHLAHKR